MRAAAEQQGRRQHNAAVRLFAKIPVRSVMFFPSCQTPLSGGPVAVSTQLNKGAFCWQNCCWANRPREPRNPPLFTAANRLPIRRSHPLLPPAARAPTTSL